MTPDFMPNKSGLLSDLAQSLHKHYTRDGELAYLKEAMTIQQNAFDLLDDDDSNAHSHLHSLGALYLEMFEKLGQVEDINKAVSLFELAIQKSENEQARPMYLNYLGSALHSQFVCSHDISQLTMSVQHLQEAIKLALNDEDKSSYINNLAISLLSQFDVLGGVAFLEDAVQNYKAIVTLTPNGHPRQAMRLSNFGTCLQRLFDHGKHASTLSQGNNSKEVMITMNLANSLISRFQQTGVLHDLDTAIAYQQETDPEKAGLYSNLGNTLQTRYEEATENHWKAVNATPDGHTRLPIKRFSAGGTLDHLAKALAQQQRAPITYAMFYDMDGDLAHLDNCIMYHEMGLKMLGDGHQHKTTMLIELGNVQVSDLDKAMLCFETALKATPEFHPARAKQYLLMAQFKSTLAWINCATLYSEPHPSVWNAYSRAFEILPFLAWHGLSHEAQLQRLIGARTLGSDAAAAAIHFGNPTEKAKSLDLAIEWFEQGRSILWSHILQLRLPFAKSAEVDPMLLQKIEKISAELDNQRGQGSFLYTSVQKLPNSLAIDDQFNRQHQLATELDTLMKQIQERPEANATPRGPKSSDLQRASVFGPICDALIIQSPTLPILHLPLDHFSQKDAEQLQSQLADLLASQLGLRDGSSRHGGPVNQTRKTADNTFRYILKELWLRVVKPIINLLQLSIQSDTSKLPHIYWCPTGHLAFLPLHAAGIYPTSSNVPAEILAKYAISSYIPNLTSLCMALEKHKQMSGLATFKMLAVIQPDTPGQSKLPATVRELAVISDCVGDQPLSVLNGTEATRETVSNALEDHTWVHLSCHGIQDLNNPAQSGLALHDGMLSLLDLVKKPLPQASFAFLSACQTASGDYIQPDEAIHLAAGLLFAGFNSIIGTMWSIKDDDAPQVAKKVYEHLFKDGKEPEVLQSAHALHIAVQDLRSRYGNTSFSSWVPYIHIGL
ncbi:CHAT domain-containing protein [Lyophyllum atratum]|nr:CHAT domain-containing protein [Lyophyllum atratum]